MPNFPARHLLPLLLLLTIHHHPAKISAKQNKILIILLNCHNLQDPLLQPNKVAQAVNGLLKMFGETVVGDGGHSDVMKRKAIRFNLQEGCDLHVHFS